MKAYTDYPFEGNENGSTIEVEVLAYDRNKYAQVNWNGEIHEVKTGYLYREPERQKNLKYSELIALPIEVGGKKMTKKEVSKYIKEENRRKTKYFVWVGSHKTETASLKKALSIFAKYYKEDKCCIIKDQSAGYWSNHMGLIESEFGNLILFSNRKNRSSLKTFHIKKYL